MGRRERKDTIIAPKEKLLSELAPVTAAFVLTSSRDTVIIFVSYFTPQFILAGVSSRMEPALAGSCQNTEIQCALQERDKPCFFFQPGDLDSVFLNMKLYPFFIPSLILPSVRKGEVGKVSDAILSF